MIVCGIAPISDFVNKNKNDKFFGSKEKVIKYNFLLKNYCTKNNIVFIDNSELETGVDGVHLTKDSHTKLAEKLYNKIINYS